MGNIGKKVNKKRANFLFIILVAIIGIILVTIVSIKLNKSTMIEDTEAPKIEGAKDQVVYIGDKVSYKKGVIVTDNIDENIELLIDSSDVNIQEPGIYDVIYKAIDTSGNIATKTIAVEVQEKPVEEPEENLEEDPLRIELNELLDGVLDTIKNEEMTQRETAKAIYNWTKYNIGYVNTSDKSDVVKAAIQGIKKKSGDCFVYFATAQELLGRANIQNQGIVKTGGGHYWSLINLGEGWYHFDATPRKGDGDYFFMLTDAQIEKYSKTHKNSHVWDREKYPETPTK